jgi:TDG/mug DNA glycosylase family protein
MQVLFVGVNPGIRSGETRHHFISEQPPLKSLDGAGFTPCVLRPAEESRLLEHGIGLTNLVDRPTPSAGELTPEELRAGAQRLRRLASRYRSGWVVILGLVTYRIAFRRTRRPCWGALPGTLCASRLWVLPGLTGRNAHLPTATTRREVREAPPRDSCGGLSDRYPSIGGVAALALVRGFERLGRPTMIPLP